MPSLACLNGRILPAAEARISPLDRGFLFGDAVYEVMRVYAGRPFLFDEHLHRLGSSLRALKIEGVDLQPLKERSLATLKQAGFAEATIYIQVTRGATATRSHTLTPDLVPLEFILVEEYRDHHAEMRRAGCRAITHPDIRWDRCDIKSTNLLGNVLAAQAAKEKDAYEAILYLPDGTLTEGSRTSLFAVVQGTLRTSPTGHEILPGITRTLALRLAGRLNVPIEEQPVQLRELSAVSELFLTGTTSEVMPIVQVDGRSVGDGKPGPVTLKLQAAFDRVVAIFRQGPDVSPSLPALVEQALGGS
jgi:D-alanine transaminase